MATTLDVIEHIGDVDLLLPRRIQAGLDANDRLKYFLALLQAAVSRAQAPDATAPDLSSVRQASGVNEAAFDDIVNRSRWMGNAALVPESGRIRDMVFGGLRDMLAPLAAAANLMPDLQDVSEAFGQRLRDLESTTPSFADDQVTPAAIETLTAPRSGTRDTVHQLVMDLHHQLNRLQSRLPLRDVDGASSWGLTPADDALVGAFMQGLRSTSSLKFDHPGLQTSAARSGKRLSIQNDLGTTDAHVVVLHVDDLTITIIYSDLHRRRVAFLQTMLERHGIAWDAAAAGTDAPLLLVGRLTVDSAADLSQFLALFASRLVFLIDWNRARKQLMRFVRKSDAVAILQWAAARDLGHRAFLQSGGAGLIYTALERAASRHALAGGRLDDLLGHATATAFLRTTLRLTSAGLSAGRSARVIQDEIEAELLSHLEDGSHNGLSVAADHATYISALAERVRRVLLRRATSAAHDESARGAALAGRWESKADDIVRRQRVTWNWSSEGELLRGVLHQGDAAADALEEAAFLITLIPEQTATAGVRPLTVLADLVLSGARDYVRCVEHARSLPRSRSGPDLDEFLVIVDRLLENGRTTRAAERETRAGLLTACGEFRELQVLSALGVALADAARALGQGGLGVRDYVLTGATSHP